MSLHSSLIQLTKEQVEIVNMCANGVRKAREDPSAPRVLIFRTVVVKFNAKNILNEGDTQAFVYDALKSLPNAPRIPKVYNCFSWDDIQYLAMEKVDFPTVEAWIGCARDKAEMQSRFDMACQAVAAALDRLFNLPPPTGAEIGLIEGAYARTQSERVRTTSGRARHPFFGDSNAPYRYTNALALEKHINKALDHLPRSAPRLAVKIASEPLVMVQGDITRYNFLIDPETLQVTIIDFGCISALPHSLVSFTLHTTRDEFIAGIAKSLGWEPSVNSSALEAAAGIYSQTAGKRFGLDKHGLPLRKAKA
ncbi:hypothetical protein FB451DRAFT_1225188 [Mycena latifolia]|nr:hypothetical protein FB451DRAFT_1225188 [Mycena latifolia]